METDPKPQFPRPFFGERRRPERLGDKLGFDVDKELDQVVGKFEDRSGTRLQRAGRIAARVLLAACLAIAAALIVMSVLNVHMMEARNKPVKPVPKKPVPVQIVPAPK